MTSLHVTCPSDQYAEQQEETMFDAWSKDPTERRSGGGKHIAELNGGIMKQLHHLARGRRTRLFAPFVAENSAASLLWRNTQGE